MESKLKVAKPVALMISRNFPPLTGGMERLNHHAYLAVSQKFATTVCGPTGISEYMIPGDRYLELPLKPLSWFLLRCQWEALRMALTLRPNLVYSGSGLTAPAALLAAKVAGARVVSFLHGLDIVVDHPAYRNIFLPAIRRCDRLLVNSRHTAQLAAAIGVGGDKIRIVHPGVAVPDLMSRDCLRAEFRQRYSLGNRPILLSVGRLTERKGLRDFIRNAIPELVRIFPDLLLLVIGDEPTQALVHKAGVIDGIRKAIEGVGATGNVRLLGKVDDLELTKAFFAADMMVFPVQDIRGDIEGFGMVALEAAAHGLPTVAFSVGGVSDAVGEGVSGWLVEPGNYRHMGAVIADYLGDLSSQPGITASCYQFAREFAWEKFDKRLISSIADLMPI